MSINRQPRVGTEHFSTPLLDIYDIPFHTAAATPTETSVKEAGGNVTTAQEPSSSTAPEAAATTPSSGHKKRRSILGKVIHHLKQ